MSVWKYLITGNRISMHAAYFSPSANVLTPCLAEGGDCTARILLHVSIVQLAGLWGEMVGGCSCPSPVNRFLTYIPLL